LSPTKFWLAATTPHRGPARTDEELPARGRTRDDRCEPRAPSWRICIVANTFRLGARVNLDVLNAQMQLYNAKRDLAKARNDVMAGVFKLRQAAGTLGPEDVLKADQLLAR
jgi:hypothetical protein